MLLYLLVFSCCARALEALPVSPGGCEHAGQVYEDNTEVAMEDPCVRCRCAQGLLVCRLRVCNPQPHPPPHGCVVLHRPSECCPRLVCAHESVESRRRLSDNFLDEGETQSGCVMHGTVYAEGSAMDSSTKCQYCYCIKGEQHCVKPQCLLAETNCTPTYTTDSCCPSKYDCSNVTRTGGQKSNLTTTTSKPKTGCMLDGRLYREGELVPREGGLCQNCYCLSGRLVCKPVVCSLPVNPQCVPVVTPGQCCPVSYNCSKVTEVPENLENIQEEDMIAQNTQSIGFNHVYMNSERSITSKSTSTQKDTTYRTTSLDTTTHEQTTMIDSTITTTREEPTTMEADVTGGREITEFTTETTQSFERESTLPSTTNPGFTNIEQRFNSKEYQTTTTKNEEFTTINNVILEEKIMSRTKVVNGDDLNSTVSSTTKALPSEIEAILNKTKASDDDDYDYDYNEPSLPPSLPNLRIIPFVAADAVVEESDFGGLEKSGNDNHFFENLHPSGFSPPAETEGGFVPKEPMLDGPFYDSSYHAAGGSAASNLDKTSATLSTPVRITEPSNSALEDKCVRGGQSYRHGELLSEPSACDLCMCYYGKILCQKPKCPVPEPGCRLLRDREPNTCCRKVVCKQTHQESPTRVVEPVTASHLPPFTVADVIVTPDPFRDVIRTEPAPDLSSLIGEIMPYFWDQSTRHSASSTTPISITTLEPVETTTEVNISSTVTSSSVKTSTNLPTVQTIPQSSTTTSSTTIESSSESSSPVTPLLTSSTTAETTTSVSLFDLFSAGDEPKPDKLKEQEDKEVKEEVPVDDEFSFDSVFSYLFDSDRWTTTTEKTVSKLPNTINQTVITDEKQNKTVLHKPPANQIIEHRSDEDIDDLHLNTSPIEKLKTSSPPVFNETKTTVETPTTTTIKSPILTTKKPIYLTTKSSLPKVSIKRFGTKYSTTPRYSRPSVTPSPSMSVPDPGAASGLLKLAGCNIYGRMYRVGKIITELSGPCLECMCTEVGVQCRPLKC